MPYGGGIHVKKAMLPAANRIVLPSGFTRAMSNARSHTG